MILFIDNYDSFTYNLVDYVGQQYRGEIVIKRNDEITIEEIKALKPDGIVISPGPGAPKDAGVSKAVIEEFYKNCPILGVCLGHQSIAEVFGGVVTYSTRMMHGKVSQVVYKKCELFKDVDNPFDATRYHSLVVEGKTLPQCLEPMAFSADDLELMALKHKEHHLYGVQFHPESILTKGGLKIISNFIGIVDSYETSY